MTKALRVLKLLEEQHQKLARIIRSQDVVQPSDVSHEDKKAAEMPSVAALSLSTTDKAPAAKVRPTTSALAVAKMGSQVRESSLSLARDIASRRGIPQSSRNQPSSAAQARARQLSPESQRRARAAPSVKVPPSIVDSQASLAQARRSKKAEDDEGFTRFYSNITSGTMSKLSSVLAYAGLPLTADDIRPEPPTRSLSGTVRAGDTPDVKKIFSKAALDAIEAEHRQRGTLGHGFGPAESFYVVPPTGGTKSYSHMVRSRIPQTGGLGEEDDEAFVDAQEAQGPPSPRHSRTAATTKRGSFGKSRTSEELELENVTLKQTLEQLAGRLSNFEAHAQDASMAALTQSMVSLRPSGGTSDAVMTDRLRQLEQQMERDAEDRQKLEIHAMKQEKQLKKWNDKYQALRAGARKKMEVKEKLEPGDDEADADGGGLG